jgi:hypothetical protein
VERSYFEKQRSDILNKILEAVAQGDSQAINSYCRILIDLEQKFKRDVPPGNWKSSIIDFNVS